MWGIGYIIAITVTNILALIQEKSAIVDKEWTIALIA